MRDGEESSETAGEGARVRRLGESGDVAAGHLWEQLHSDDLP